MMMPRPAYIRPRRGRTAGEGKHGAPPHQPQLVHVAFIDNARSFLRVRRIKREGVALWRRRRARNRNRSSIAILILPSGRTDVRPFVFPATVITTDQSREKLNSEASDIESCR